ncbi:rhodanese-like domain-containing protein [Denitrificimonas sp. JX-1]|uniref:Rhodanese-like domain-containing protein n=1 Tax=Denitrificimonas halotolerans TaxID=3098930 RepID=A0ABU5GSN0_9GAMM|nr:rhodanese-like domain-containing protein [Denitrificimonas sp. JX-1]MDY7219998.1 rhodanese-like domain-containing protein [Denitrificimonas sp. JX-1]
MTRIQNLISGVVLSLAVFSVQAVELAISAEDAYAKTQQTEQPVLLVDVRDPVEIMFVGFTDAVDVNIPFMLVDRSQWNAERNIFPIKRNPEFVEQIKAELAKRGLDENTEVITMCRSGSERGEPSAKVLREAGLVNARFVVNGFQGDALSEGPQAGMRLKNGWQNSGLPWSRSLNGDKIYRLDR